MNKLVMVASSLLKEAFCSSTAVVLVKSMAFSSIVISMKTKPDSAAPRRLRASLTMLTRRIFEGSTPSKRAKLPTTVASLKNSSGVIAGRPKLTFFESEMI